MSLKVIKKMLLQQMIPMDQKTGVRFMSSDTITFNSMMQKKKQRKKNRKRNVGISNAVSFYVSKNETF